MAQNKFTDALGEALFGTRRTSRTHCVCHNRPQTPTDFRDTISVLEWNQSGLCQETQDRVFGGDDDDDGPEAA